MNRSRTTRFSPWPVVLPVCAVAMAVAVFAVTQNVQRRETHVTELNRQLLTDQQTLRVLDAEWAYLTRPQRLEELMAMKDTHDAAMPPAPTPVANAAPAVAVPAAPVEKVAVVPAAEQKVAVAAAITPETKAAPEADIVLAQNTVPVEKIAQTVAEGEADVEPSSGVDVMNSNAGFTATKTVTPKVVSAPVVKAQAPKKVAAKVEVKKSPVKTVSASAKTAKADMNGAWHIAPKKSYVPQTRAISAAMPVKTHAGVSHPIVE